MAYINDGFWLLFYGQRYCQNNNEGCLQGSFGKLNLKIDSRIIMELGNYDRERDILYEWDSGR